MPVYNAAAYVVEAVKSTLAQTMADFELIAVDDGSNDSSLEVLQRLAAQDDRMTIVSRANTGIVGALNDGLAKMRGEFVARMDADDVALPHRFATQLDYLRSNPDCVAVGSAVLQIDPDGDPICVQPWAESHEEIERLLLAGGGGLAHPTAMICSAAMRQIGGYRKEFEWIEDKDLWLRLAEVGRLANLSEPLLKYRLHESSVSWRRESEQRRLWKHLLEEAYCRRGLTTKLPVLPERSECRATSNRDRCKWIRAAAKDGHYRTALKHMRHLVWERPLAAKTWITVVRGGIGGLANFGRNRRSVSGNPL
jgi:glycosyltransferase involved in cell wall biosynthesis